MLEKLNLLKQNYQLVKYKTSELKSKSQSNQPTETSKDDSQTSEQQNAAANQLYSNI